MTPSTPGNAADPNPLPPIPLPHPDTNPRTFAMAFAVAAALKNRAAALDKELRKHSDRMFHPDEELRVYHPVTGAYLGLVNVGKGGYEAVFTDQAATEAWYAAEHPQLCQEELTLTGSPADIINALMEHAPEDLVAKLVTSTMRPTSYELDDLLARTAAAGKPVGPEGEIDETAPPGVVYRYRKATVTVKLNGSVGGDGEDQLMQMVREGLATPEVPALPDTATTAA